MQFSNNILKKLNLSSTFSRFIIVGIINTIIGYSLIMLFFHIFSLTYGVSYFLSYIIAFSISFFLNRQFVFESKNKKLKEFLKFIVAFLISYSISYVFLYIFIEYKVLNENIAFFAGMIVYSTIFYLLNKYMTFKNN